MILDELFDEDGDEDFGSNARAYISSEIDDCDEEGGGVDEVGALAPQGSRGGSGSNNATMVAGEKRKRRVI